MQSARSGGLAVMLALVLFGCGPDPAPIPRAEGTSTPTSAVPVPTGAIDPVPPPGPTTLIAATPANLVALDLATGEATVLATIVALAAELGTLSGRFEGVDLSPDGSTVAFAFDGVDDRENGGADGLYEVPADGSSPARRVALDAEEAFVSDPQYSPDGRFLSVYTGRLILLDEQRSTTGNGTPMPYPPRWVRWTPNSDGLVLVPYLGRAACCPITSVSVDPATGQITDAPNGDQLDGLPYFDSSGELRTVPDDVSNFDVETSGRFVVASDRESQELFWWDTTIAGEPQRHPLPLDISLQQPTAIAW